MKKRYFWAYDGDQLFRFRSRIEREKWGHDKTFVSATHPEVRRIQRRMAAGEQITFPVEV